MAKISDAEVRRLLSYLKQNIDDENIGEIEDELRGDYAEEFLRDEDLLPYFPELFEELLVAGGKWKLRIIPHAHLRMVQRGVKINSVCAFFRSFVELYSANEQSIAVGNYALYGRIKSQNQFVTIRIDLDTIADVEGAGHVVTVYVGRGNNEGITEVDLPAL